MLRIQPRSKCRISSYTQPDPFLYYTLSEQHTGSNIVIAVDVRWHFEFTLIRYTDSVIQLSGDGKIPQSSFVPGSNADTRYDFFEIYLVSPSFNFTVSNGSTILSQESGSTVKHLNFPLPTCVEAGSYNVCTSLPFAFNIGVDLSVYPRS